MLTILVLAFGLKRNPFGIDIFQLHLKLLNRALHLYLLFTDPIIHKAFLFL